MEHWKNKETRCKGKRERDGKRCKVRTPTGEYLCEHHKQDLPSFVKDPNSCIEIIQKRFPKRHHPACDRKGQNDCECPEYSRGAHAMMALRKAISTSQSLSPLYRRLNSLKMRLKVKKIRAYYRTIDEAELWLPYKPGWRQFRFFLWDDKQERIIVRIIKDNIKNKATLLKWLRKLAPLHVYYTTSAWLNPQGIGPDPNGKRGRSKFRKKGWKLKQYHNTMLWQELYFDVDYDIGDYNEGAKMLQRVITVLNKRLDDESSASLYEVPEAVTIYDKDNKYITTLDESRLDAEKCMNISYMRSILSDDTIGGLYNMGKPMFVFSGGKGFHLIYPDFRLSKLPHIKTTYEKNVMHHTEKSRQKMSKNLRMDIIDSLRSADKELLLDWEVTVDPRRIIRLPGTVHGKTLRVCKVITDMDDFIYDNGNIVGYNVDDPIG